MRRVLYDATGGVCRGFGFVPKLGMRGAILNKKEQLQFERLERLLAVERERAESAWAGYREALYQLVDLRMKLEAVERALHGHQE